jgi:hypothetical protein
MKIIQTNTADNVQHFPAPAHGRHATAHHTLHQLAATSPCGHSTAMKKLNLTKPLILHEKKKKKLISYPRTRYHVTKFNFLHNSYYLTTPNRDKNTYWDKTL